MAQHDMDIANQAGAAVRADLNNALLALVSNNSGATAPATTFAYMPWADTANDLLKQRNAANTAWITLMKLSTAEMQANALLAGSASQLFSVADPTSAAHAVSAQKILLRATVASSATTSNIWAAAGHQIDWTGTATTTAFPNAPYAGAHKRLIAAGACSFTAGANMIVSNVPSGSTVTLEAGDIIDVESITTTQFKLTIKKQTGALGTKASTTIVAGNVGEVISNSATGVSLTSGAPANITSITLTPGRWVVSGSIGARTATSTSLTQVSGGSSTVSVTFPATPNYLNSLFSAIVPGNGNLVIYPIPTQVFAVDTNTTLYLIGSIVFTASTCTGEGGILAVRL